MKSIMAVVLLACAVPNVYAQQDKTYTIRESELTEDQKKKLVGKDIKDEVHSWAGVGKEVGEAVNSSLQAITVQTNEFAKTGVGKVTVALVVWKVVGSEMVHLVSGIIELFVFLPLWIWSYRRTCITRTFKMPDKTVKVVEYDPSRWRETPSPRIAHCILICVFCVVWLITVFSF